MKNTPLIFFALISENYNVGVRGEKPPLHGSRNARVEWIDIAHSVLCDATPIFPKLFANFDAFLRQRGTWGRHSELLIRDCDSIFVSLS